MTQVDKLMKLYKENKVTTLEVKHMLSARKYKEWYNKLYNYYESQN